MGCNGLGGIRLFLGIDKNFPNWEIGPSLHSGSQMFAGATATRLGQRI
jgi:hypothetical protein